MREQPLLSEICSAVQMIFDCFRGLTCSANIYIFFNLHVKHSIEIVNPPIEFVNPP